MSHHGVRMGAHPAGAVRRGRNVVFCKSILRLLISSEELLGQTSAALEMQEHSPNQPAPSARGTPAPHQFGMTQSLNYRALAEAPPRASSGEKLPNRVRQEIRVQRNPGALIRAGPLQKQHLWLSCFGTGQNCSQADQQACTQRAETPPSPALQEGTRSPTLSQPITVPAGLLICQGSSSRCGTRTVEPSSAGCHGDAKHGHLPIPVPAVGQHGAQAADFPWGRPGAPCASCRTPPGRILHPPSQQRGRQRGLSTGWSRCQFREPLELEWWREEVLG